VKDDSPGLQLGRRAERHRRAGGPLARPEMRRSSSRATPAIVLPDAGGWAGECCAVAPGCGDDPAGVAAGAALVFVVGEPEGFPVGVDVAVAVGPGVGACEDGAAATAVEVPPELGKGV
jgi:precorrin-3B methylase